MSGQPGRSGRKQKPLALHLLRGTYRRDRHGVIPDQVPPPPVYDWTPSADDLARLGPAGRAFLEEALRTREYNFAAGMILLMAAELIDSRNILAADVVARGMLLTLRGGAQRVNPSLKESWRCGRLLSQLLKSLDLNG